MLTCLNAETSVLQTPFHPLATMKPTDTSEGDSDLKVCDTLTQSLSLNPSPNCTWYGHYLPPFLASHIFGLTERRLQMIWSVISWGSWPVHHVVGPLTTIKWTLELIIMRVI